MNAVTSETFNFFLEVERINELSGDRSLFRYRQKKESNSDMSTGVRIICARLTPHASMALISLSPERRPKTSIVVTRAAMGIEYDSVPGSAPLKNSSTITMDIPLAMYCVTLNINATDITKLNMSNASRNVVMKLEAIYLCNMRMQNIPDTIKKGRTCKTALLAKLLKAIFYRGLRSFLFL
jgi:hypothetical protein